MASLYLSLMDRYRGEAGAVRGFADAVGAALRKAISDCDNAHTGRWIGGISWTS